MRRLSAALTLAAEGQGGVILVTGQPGIGKTRLAQEALALARERGFAVLEGHAYLVEAGLAYGPFLDAFGPLLRGLHPPRLKALTKGLTDLGRLFSGLCLPPPEPVGDPALEKTRLFEAVSRLLDRLTSEKPVALFLDDVHQADPATLELLHYLARSLNDRRALLLATCSTLDTPQALRATLRSLEHDGVAEDMTIPRLSRDAVDELVRGILKGEAPGELLSLIHARAGGTPLFVVGLIRTLIESGHLARSSRQGDGWIFDANGSTMLPSSSRHLILERLERLEADDRRVLDLIAVMGDATSHNVLRATGRLQEENILGSVRRLRAAGLVAEVIDGPGVAYTITHPLIQEFVYSELPEMERRHIHLAATEAIESFSEGRPDDATRLVRHHRGAGPEADPKRALTALVMAGERALAVYANEEASQHFEAALAMLREGRVWRVEGGEGDPSILSIVLERLGEAWERIGKREEAVSSWNEALAERERAGDVAATTRLRHQLALAEWDRGHFDVANAHLESGLEALINCEPCQELAELHFARYQIVSRLGDVAGVAAAAAELLSAAERLGSPRAEAEANLVSSISCLWQNDVTSARRRALHVLTIGEQTQEQMVCCHAHAILTVIGMRLGDHRLVRYHAERGLPLAQRLGASYFEVLLRLRLAYAHFMAADWDESLRCSMEAIELARRVGRQRDLAAALAGQAMLLALRGALPEAEVCISEVRTTFDSGPPNDRGIFGPVDVAEVVIALGRGNEARALDIARDLVRPWAWEATPVGLTLMYIPMGLMLLAEAQVAAGEPESALETARKLMDLGPPGTPYITALAARAEGLGWQALGQREAALDCLTRAQEMFAALKMPFESARSLLDYATVATVARPGLAARAVQQSLATFERLGAQRYAERARRLLRVLGISPPASRRPRLGGVSVSERELEIARLVAQGFTTPEIARRLTLSPGTVATHLHRIYTRLGVSSRAALARLVIEAGLLSPRSDII